jgi:hypothetical protein
MNIAKNMEAIFFVAIALVSVTGFATASAHVVPSRNASAADVVTQGTMPVVTISAKRLSAAEKAAAAQ